MRKSQKRSTSTLSSTRHAANDNAGRLSVGKPSRFTGFGQTVGDVFSIPVGKVGRRRYVDADSLAHLFW